MIFEATEVKIVLSAQSFAGFYFIYNLCFLTMFIILRYFSIIFESFFMIQWDPDLIKAAIIKQIYD